MKNEPPKEDENTERLATRDIADALRSSERYAALMILQGSLAGQLFRLQADETVVGRSDDADIVVKDRGVSRQHAKFLQSPQGVVTVVDLDSTNGVFVGGERVQECILEAGDKVAIGGLVTVRLSYHDALEEKLQNELYHSATRDGLTGCVNKQHFTERLGQAASKARRHRNNLSIAMIDIDHFKSVNDGYGHVAGDAVLKEVAGRLSEGLRTEDLLGRFGGEEFVVLMDLTATEGAVQVAERLRTSVCAKPILVPSKDAFTEILVTASLGVATLAEGETDESLMMRADQALYQAKADGRNRVATEGTPGPNS